MNILIAAAGDRCVNFIFKECIESYTRRKWQFDALDKFFASIPEQLCEEYLTTVIPFMATLALSAPDLITQVILFASCTDRMNCRDRERERRCCEAAACINLTSFWNGNGISVVFE